VHTANQLIKDIANGDKKAFKLFYEQYKDKVYNVALSYVQDQQEAEDITQEVFIAIFQKASSFKGEAGVSTWVYRITVNTSLNFIKRRKRYSLFKIGFERKESRDFEHPGIVLENKEDANLLFKTIDTLPTTQKTAFILGYIEQLPRQEIADIMEVSLKAVESLLQRAKVNLRKELKKRLS